VGKQQSFLEKIIRDGVARPEVQQYSGQWQVKRMVMTLAFEPLLVDPGPFHQIGYSL
jgi:hypothetical protein